MEVTNDFKFIGMGPMVVNSEVLFTRYKNYKTQDNNTVEIKNYPLINKLCCSIGIKYISSYILFYNRTVSRPITPTST